MDRKISINKVWEALPDYRAIPKAFAVRSDEDLPAIDILGHCFLIDWLERQLRPEDKKTGPIPLAAMNQVFDENTKRLRFLYNPETRALAPEPRIGLDYPKDILIMEIPADPRILDPKGLAMELGLDPVAFMKRHPQQLMLTAKIVPWQSTRYAKAVEENNRTAERVESEQQNTALQLQARPAKKANKKRSSRKGI